MYKFEDTGLPVWPTCSLWGLQPISETGLEQAVAAPSVSASDSIIAQFSGPLSPLPAETTISASAIVTDPVSFSIFNIFWFESIPFIFIISFLGLFGFSTIPKEFEVILIIFISEFNSVKEKALFVKQVLFTVNGLLLSGNSTTFETNDESVMPDK